MLRVKFGHFLSNARGLVLALIVIGLLTSPVLAQEIPSTVNFAPFYDPNETAGNKFTCSSGQFIGSENAEVAFNYFRSIGLTDDQAAGIVGNLIAESGVIPNRAQGNGIQTINSIEPILADIAEKDPEKDQGFGIAQWTSDGRQQAWLNFAEEKGADPLSLELQLEFLLTELEQDENYGYKQLQEAESLLQSTWVFLSYFERPRTVIDAGKEADSTPPTGGSAKQTLDERVEYAQPIINQYSGTFVPVSGTCGFNFDTSEPSFASIPSIQIDNPPVGIHLDSNCTGDFTEGAESLRQFVLDNFSPPVTSVGGYDCRSIRGGSQTSLHGLGRAIDIMVDATNPSDRETGDKIRNLLYNNAETFGVQQIIWNRKIWTADQDGWRDYSGTNPHTDHLHVEININAGNNPDLAG